VRATDAAGNTGGGEASVTVVPATSRALSFSDEKIVLAAGAQGLGSTFLACVVDGAAPAPCPANLTFSGLSYGTHTVKVVDPARPEIQFPTFSWTSTLRAPLLFAVQFPPLVQVGSPARQAATPKRRLPRLLFHSSAPGQAALTLTRSGQTVSSWTETVARGGNVLTLPRSAWRALRPGRYLLRIGASNGAGAGSPVAVRFDAIRATKR
jgi:hypothetical protein